MAAPAAALRPVRWKTGLVLLALSPVAVLAAWFVADKVADGDRTTQMVAAVATLAAAALVQVVWWLVFSRLTWRSKAIGACAILAVAGAAYGTVRMDGLRGEMLPIFAFRWQPTPEQRAIAFFADAKPHAAPATAEQDTLAVAEGDWPQFRGPRRDGVVPGVSIAADWDAHPPKTVWRHPVGLGWSSFAVVGDFAFTQEQRGEDECVVGYDALTGDQRWVHADKARFSESLGSDGPRATPTFADGRLYALGATGILHSLDPRTGEVLWTRNILIDAAGSGEDAEPVENLVWGMAGSPLVDGGKVYVVPGGKRGRGVIAYDAGTGDVVWAAGDHAASYAAPRIETIAGTPQLLVFDAAGLSAYDPETGAALWDYPWKNQPEVNSAQPVVSDDKVFIGSAYGQGSVLLSPRRTASGWTVSEVWKKPNEFKLKFNDAVLHDGFLYGLDEGILACYGFADGERKWKKGRYGYGQLILLGETLVVVPENDGEIVAVRATPDRFEELGRFAGVGGKTWNHLAFAHGRLYVRNDREAACFALTPTDGVR